MSDSEYALKTIEWGRVARFLGWFSIGLGLCEVLAPRKLSRGIGIARPKTGLTGSFGLREMTAGFGILSGKQTGNWVWARVGGDVLDLIALASALPHRRNRRGRLLGAMAAVAGVTGLDALCAAQLSQQGSERSGTRLTKTVTINRSADDLYRFWLDARNLPCIMPHITRVDAIDEQRSHWVASGPGGMQWEWDSEITESRAPTRLAWRSMPGAALEHSGAVELRTAPGNRGTEMKVRMEYRLPGNGLGRTVATLLGHAPEQEMDETLRRFKQLMETGEIARSEGAAQGSQFIPPPARRQEPSSAAA